MKTKTSVSKKRLRQNTKTKRVRKNRRILGMSIAERPPEIEERAEFGHWEIDTMKGQKSDDNALLTLVGKHRDGSRPLKK